MIHTRISFSCMFWRCFCFVKSMFAHNHYEYMGCMFHSNRISFRLFCGIVLFCSFLHCDIFLFGWLHSRNFITVIIEMITAHQSFLQKFLLQFWVWYRYLKQINAQQRGPKEIGNAPNESYNGAKDRKFIVGCVHMHAPIENWNGELRAFKLLKLLPNAMMAKCNVRFISLSDLYNMQWMLDVKCKTRFCVCTRRINCVIL